MRVEWEDGGVARESVIRERRGRDESLGDPHPPDGFPFDF
jgi:hypothetical protein